MSRLFAFSSGLLSIAWWPVLLGPIALSCLVICALPFVSWRSPPTWFLLLLGIVWGTLSAYYAATHVLSESLDRKDFLLTGHITSLVDHNDRRIRFTLSVASAALVDDPSQVVPIKRVVLSWYRASVGFRDLAAGDWIEFEARLRRPRGLLNPGGFDYQAWLLQQGIDATGYVRRDVAQRKGSSAISASLFKGMITAYRARLSDAIQALPIDPRGRATLSALTVGDKRYLGDLWHDFRRFGIVHLLVISGLHVGMIASLGWFFGFFIVHCYRIFLRVFLLPHNVFQIARWAPPVCAIIAALGYSLLAGLSLSTQRALIAVVVTMLCAVYLRKPSPAHILGWCLCGIGICQPMATLSAGFWLSFGAVTLLMGALAPWGYRRYDVTHMAIAQGFLWVGLLLPLLLLSGQASWLAPAINLVAIPWLSLLTVPLAVAGAALFFILPSWAVVIWQLADQSLQPLWWVIETIPDDWGFVSLPLALSFGVAIALASVSLSLLLPRGFPYRGLLPLPFIGLISVPPPHAPLRMTVLDVGQALAVIVETAEHVLVYDTGARYSEKLDAGRGIIAPFLRRRGHLSIDLLMISHEDNDHSGGADGLVQSLPVERILHGPGYRLKPLSADSADGEICRSSQSWTWDLVSFRVLAPNIDSPDRGNNSSCVLLITWRGHSILLPGDIERAGERALLDDMVFSPPLDVLIAPHHGSKTSSGSEWVRTLSPEHVVFSAGYQHHFGHPHKRVRERYFRQNSRAWSTAENGAITFQWTDSGLQLPAAERNGFSVHWR